jgi:threonine/homoserine/homoserine lactone efflux protein
MSTSWDHVVAAATLGFVLGSAPGPVQLLILSETAKGGFTRGLRVMVGANGTLFVIVAGLALGFSAISPGPGVLRGLRVVGGAFLIYVALEELRTLRREARTDTARTLPPGRLGPTARGAVAVIVNPGAWIFFATTASTLVAQATADGGRTSGLLVAGAMTVGVSAADLVSTLIGTGGRALLGERGLRRIRAGLAVVLLGIGIVFVLQGLLART